MTRLAAAALLAAIVSTIAATAAFAASPRPDGLWKAINDQDNKPSAMIRLRSGPGGVLQGWLTASLRGDDPNRVCDKCQPPRQGQRIIGMQVVWGVTPDPANPLHWQNGQILDPDSGGIYSCDIVESADGKSLTVRGYFGVITLGRTQMWYRAGA
jgi:uncharacterized protein (DUF2147 family)